MVDLEAFLDMFKESQNEVVIENYYMFLLQLYFLVNTHNTTKLHMKATPNSL